MHRFQSLSSALTWLALVGCPRVDPATTDRRLSLADGAPPPDGTLHGTTPPASASASVSQVYVGVIAASEKADIGPVVAGEVMAVHVRPGDVVESGQLLVTLDARRAREELRMTEATLRSEMAALEQAVVDRQETASRLAEVEELALAGAAAKGAVKDARFQHQRARAADARAAAVVAQWRTKRAQLERQLADTELRAPFSGTVAERYIDPGGLAGPGVPVVRLISSNSLWVRFAVPPGDLARLTVGTIVATRIEEPVITAVATVRNIAPETDAASQFVFVDAELELEDRLRARIQVGSAAWVHHIDPEPRGQ